MRKQTSRKKRAKIGLSLIFVILGIGMLTFEINRRIEPNINAIGRLNAEGVVNALINETVVEEFSVDENEKLFYIEYGNNGNIQMVQIDTVLINQKMNRLALTLQEKYKHLEPEKVRIPIGALFGSTLLSQTESGIEIQVLPMSVSTYDYRTGFESQGINQTKYRLYAEIKSTVRILQPFSQESLTVATKVLISEVVILGDVPENYVHVPKEDILDVT